MLDRLQVGAVCLICKNCMYIVVTFLRRILVGREDKCIAEHDWIDARESHGICHDPARSGGGGSQPKQRFACRGVFARTS